MSKTHSTDNGGKHKLRKMAFADKKWGKSKGHTVDEEWKICYTEK